ncbi:protein expanded isoform X2 [Hyposmocoma kahamanoa]|nr:protein expanded isoform X2 [Hyposmocoma kahamanoa]XP_026315430.1 protein expanded isoform X2 [Hyposmocoma kahamanoa]
MRALCSVRGPLGGETRALGAGARLLSLRMPGQPQPLHFVVEAKAKVKELKALANAHAQLQGMTDTDLFGLAVMQNGEYLFVDLESKLSKYAPKSWRSSHTHGLDANGKPLLELHLVVQFHVESPLLLHDEVGRHLYFLQLRHNVRCRDTLPAEVLLLLTGLALQAQYGDADGYADRDYFKVEDYAPTSLTGDWVAAAMRACHREHRGLSRIDAESRFIREVCLLPDTMNSHRYRLKQNKSEPDPGTIWLFVTAKGIKILPDNGPVSNFIWTSIGKLSFDRKKFEIRTEDGKITLYSSSEEKCKYLFALCKETHQFSMKIAPKFKEILSKEEEERKICYGYPKSLNLQYIQNKSEQRISVISSTSSNTTSGIVSDRVQSEDELEIMIDSPPAPSTESLAFAHLLDCTNAYFIQHTPDDNKPFAKTSSLQLQKAKLRNKKNLDEIDTIVKNDISTEIGQSSRMQIEETISLPDQSITEISTDSPGPNKLKCTGSQCSSSCSTVIMARAGLNTLSRASDASSLELGFSHTTQNSMLSDNSTVGTNIEYSQDTASALYDGLGQPMTIAASSETSGVYTMGSSELTARSKIDALSDGSRTDYNGSHYDSYKPSPENDLAEIDSVSSILKNKSERTSQCTGTLRIQTSRPSTDCVDGATNFPKEEHAKENMFRERTNSNVSTVSFHGDGSDPTDNTRNLLSASELTDLIVGRGVYPKSQSVSDTLDSVSDYVRLPLPFSGDSYLQGYEDTAPSDDNYPDNSFFDRPPTPPTRTDSRKMLNLSLPNILNIDENTSVMPKFHDKPPPPYEYNHKTLSAQLSTPTKAPPAYPGTAVSSLPLKQQGDKEEVAARVVTSRPMITILKAEAGEVNASSERTFASPMVLEHRFQKSKRHQASSRRAERSKLAQGICSLSPSRELPPTHHGVNANVLVAMMKLPPPPPPPRRTRLPPPPPVSRLPPPPPPHNSMFHQQLYSDVDYVYYPIQDPAISQQNYLDHKLTESRVSNMHKNSLQYRSTPYLSTSLSASSMYGSIQNLSDSYVQLPGTRTSWYSLTSRTSLSNHSTNLERPPIPTRLSEISSFTRARSHENVLNAKDPPPVKMRRMPPPPPPPYEHKKKLPSHLQELKASNCVYNDANVVNKVKDANCDLDIKTLREKSKNLDLPLIAALCNDRSLLKQTKAFGMPKLSKQTFSDCESERKCAKSVQSTTDSIDLKIKQESNIKRDITGSQKKILMRNPTDKLPALPGTATHTPRAMSNTYVIHPSVAKTKKIQPNS